MKRPIFFLLLFVTLMIYDTVYAIKGKSNDEATILTGTIHNEDEEGLPGASVVLYNDESETEMISGRSSDENGVFTLEVAPGRYLLKISFVSYESYRTEVKVSSGIEKDLGIIQLEVAATQMDEVTVDAERSRLEMDIDRRVFHVEEDITSLGGSALDVLDYVPSLSTDFDGNISLRGSQGVRVLINGRPSNLVRDGTDGLSSIPAHMIKNIAIITNPSARYEAEGTGGIINIVLVDGAEFGFNGTASVRTGMPHDHRASTNFNLN